MKTQRCGRAGHLWKWTAQFSPRKGVGAEHGDPAFRGFPNGKEGKNTQMKAKTGSPEAKDMFSLAKTLFLKFKPILKTRFHIKFQISGFS